ncbi:MAG: hypothetical protein U1E15_06035 [Hyphomicrobiales bacterium]
MPDGLRLLLMPRTHTPFENRMSLVGGYVIPSEDETAAATARRVLWQKCDYRPASLNNSRHLAVPAVTRAAGLFQSPIFRWLPGTRFQNRQGQTLSP